MWQGRRRLRRLESAVAEARQAQADLQRRVDLFEKIAEAAGVALGGPDDAVPVPPSLLAAASVPRQDGVPVRLTVDGREMIAVIGGEGGEPGEWWAAIRRLAARPRIVR
ncbi:MAG TPA: hypothetical protein VK162_06220 [Streptosporangiaceae bacterium]|nr:hypothetical protein [Streptosporangiaceae bacterium]